MRARLFSVVVVLSIELTVRSGHGFQIDDVGVFPSAQSTVTSISLIVSMTAPSAPAYLFAPTAIDFDGNSISIDLFVGSGPLDVITQFDEQVDLGLLSSGTYQYRVELTTEFPVGWGLDRRVATGTFSVAGPELPGDYNNNGVVDSADFIVWRKNLGAAPGTLPNDVDGGIIDQRQYNTWKANFGGALDLATGLDSTLVPEPSLATMMAFALLVLQSIRRRSTAIR